MTGYWWRSLVAMLLSLWTLSVLVTVGSCIYEAATTLGDFSLIQTAINGIGFGFIVSIYALIGWLLFVLPLTLNSRTRAWLVHPRFTAVTWAFLGALSFNVMLQPFVFAWDIFAISWIPAAIGAVAGAYFRWLTRPAKIP
ncbi:MAG: hypothetical protein SynsKO_04740 [Synoicihabitans sp.]